MGWLISTWSYRSLASSTRYLSNSAMRPEDILVPTPAGLCCKPGGFHIDPTRPVDKAADHPRPFRSCAAGPRRGAGHAGNARHDAAALWRQFRRLRRRRSAMARASTLGDVNVSFHPAGHVLGSAQIAVELRRAAHRRLRRLQGRRRSDLRAVRAGALRRLHHRGDLRPAGVPPSATPTARSRSCCARVALFPERAHLVGAYSLGKAQRVIALLREAGYDEPIYLHGAMEKITRYYQEPRHRARRCRARCAGAKKAELAGTITLARRRRCSDVWSRRFPDPVTAFASGWMRVRARARQRGVELPLVISDHADWDGLTATIAATGAVGNLGHAWPGRRAGALVHDARLARAAARSRRLWRRGRDDDSRGRARREA